MKIESAFLCDDVRQEGNGKLMFIGSYSQDVVLPKFPAALSLHAILCVRFGKPDTFDLEVEAFLDDGLQLKGVLGVNNILEGFGFLDIPIMLPSIGAPGTLKVKVRRKDEKWNEVLSIELKTPNPAASGSPRPS